MVETPAIRFAGLDPQGKPLLDVVIGLPPAATRDSPAADGQRENVRQFYGSEVSGLTASQADILLACRDYGRECAPFLYPSRRPEILEIFARIIAIFVTAEDERRDALLDWRRDATSHVRDYAFFRHVHMKCAEINLQMLRSGYDIDCPSTGM